MNSKLPELQELQELHGKVHFSVDLSGYYTYEHGVKQGEYLSFYEDGSTCVKTFYKNDKLHGEFIQYSECNGVYYHVFYVDGVEHNAQTFIKDFLNVTESEISALRYVFGDNFFAAQSAGV